MTDADLDGAAERRLAGSLFDDVPDRLEAERFDRLLRGGCVEIERIISTGQTTPAGDWYDQAWDEWVLVLSGEAVIAIEASDAPHRLGPGDYLFLPAHVRHQVTYTATDRPTVWLAIHIGKPSE